MNIESIKIDLVQRLLTIESEEVLHEIEKILDRDIAINPALQEAIREGLENITKGETQSHSEVRKLYDKWV
jgi:predicted transcriptional regulator